MVCYGEDGSISMAQAIVNPEQVRRFAAELRTLRATSRTACPHSRRASMPWGRHVQDQEHTKFAEEFDQTMKVLRRFLEASHRHAPYLLRKAQRIEEYLDQR